MAHANDIVRQTRLLLSGWLTELFSRFTKPLTLFRTDTEPSKDHMHLPKTLYTLPVKPDSRGPGSLLWQAFPQLGHPGDPGTNDMKGTIHRQGTE